MIAMGSSRLQWLEKLWLSLSRCRLLEETGAITAHPFWKGSQQVQPAVIVPENKLEGAVSGSRGNGEDVLFQRAIRICTAPGRELKMFYDLVCTAGRHCARQRHARALRSLQMDSGLLTLQPEQHEAQIFRLVLNPIPKIHPLILPRCTLSLRLKSAWCSYLCSQHSKALNFSTPRLGNHQNLIWMHPCGP